MRADRLLSLVMLLQTLGRTSAQKLSEELEVSVRTIYRDITALSSAGVPVYAERGPGGGVALVDEYRTTLNGLSPEEAQALFMLNIPAALTQLGVGKELKAAMLKLSAALPDSRRKDQKKVQERILLDSTWWFQSEEDVPCLQMVQRAVWEERKLRLLVHRDIFNVRVEQKADPYGLVAKASVWYLVYGRAGSIQTVRLSQIERAEMLAEAFMRPPDFDLAAFWKGWCDEFEAKPPFVARVRLAPDIQEYLPCYLDEGARQHMGQPSKPDAEGWVTLDLPFDSFATARNRLLGMGRAAEVLEPEVLRKSLIDFAEQIVGSYRAKGGP